MSTSIVTIRFLMTQPDTFLNKYSYSDSFFRNFRIFINERERDKIKRVLYVDFFRHKKNPITLYKENGGA